MPLDFLVEMADSDNSVISWFGNLFIDSSVGAVFKDAPQTSMKLLEQFSSVQLEHDNVTRPNIQLESGRTEEPSVLDKSSDYKVDISTDKSKIDSTQKVDKSKVNQLIGLTSTSAALTVAYNASHIQEAAVSVARYVQGLVHNVAGNDDVTRQNDPVKHEVIGALDSQIPLSDKFDRISFKEDEQRQKPNRIFLDMEATPYKTELQDLAFKFPDNNDKGTFYKLGDLRSKLLRYTFHIMEKHTKDMDEVAFFTLDFPLPQKDGKNLYTRVRKYRGSDELRYYNISLDLPYSMQPMFPRIVYIDGCIEEIDDMWRLEIKQKLYEDTVYLWTHRGSRFFDRKYFTPKERKLMLAYLEVEKTEASKKDDTKRRRIRQYMKAERFEDVRSIIEHNKGRKKQERIEILEMNQSNITKTWLEIDNKMMYAFRTIFFPKYLGVYYFLEMGCHIEPFN